MEPIELSVMSYDASTPGLQDLLAEFEARHHVKVHIIQVPRENGWTQIVKYALYGDAPAVFEIGSTWVASLASMNALRPFAAHELASFGGESAFLATAWNSGRLYRDSVVWAMPWLMSHEQLHDPNFMARVGVALPPGVPLVSESHLVVWKNIPARHEKLAVELVRFFTDKPVQWMCSQQVGLLPVRLEVLDAPPFSDHPLYQVLSQGLKTGLEPLAQRLNRILHDSPREES